MAHLCPAWAGPLLANPLRKLLENPDTLLGPFVRPGMTVLEPGSGMGFFTLPLARMVGPRGRVIVVEAQQGMLDGLRTRAAKAGVLDRLELRLVSRDATGMEGLDGQVDFALAMHVVHEVPDTRRFLAGLARGLKPGARLLVSEPRFHVSAAGFAAMLAMAEDLGLALASSSASLFGRRAVFTKG